jgi:hypothetical protein
MSDPVTPYRDTVSVCLALFSMFGTTVAFLCTLFTWRKGQRWQRSEKLDEMILYFEGNDLLQLACIALDWPSRDVEFRGKEFSYTDEDVLMAVGAIGKDRASAMRATPVQARLRDAIDVLLSFFLRLETAISSGLVDTQPARTYFAYWVERLVSLDRHPGVDKPEDGYLSGAHAVALYIQTFSDADSMRRLEAAFELKKRLVKLPAEDRLPCGEN